MQRDAAHGVLGDVVVDFEPGVGDEARERLAPFDGVAECLGKRRLGR